MGVLPLVLCILSECSLCRLSVQVAPSNGQVKVI